MFTLVRSDSNSQDFLDLVQQLDADLAQRYGTTQLSYNKYNKIQNIDTIVIAYINNIAVGCGCFKPFDEQSIEIKRMYVKPKNRGTGISKKILFELEKWAAELGFSESILETGVKQHEAIGLYNKNGYHRIDNYDQYAGMPNSICFGKCLSKVKE